MASNGVMLPGMTDRPESSEPAAGGANVIRDLLPHRLARAVRRLTTILGLAALAWFLLKYETRWVPSGCNTMEAVPGGSWVILDSWCSGLGVGSDIFVQTPHGALVSRVSEVRDGAVVISHPNPKASWGDSAMFGPIPLDQVVGTIVAAFAPSGDAGGI